MPVYYRGYREVLKGSVEPEAIIGASCLQRFLANVLLGFLCAHPRRKELKFFTNEFGVQIARTKWRACDIAIYHRERLQGVPKMLRSFGNRMLTNLFQFIRVGTWT